MKKSKTYGQALESFKKQRKLQRKRRKVRDKKDNLTNTKDEKTELKSHEKKYSTLLKLDKCKQTVNFIIIEIQRI